MTDTDEKEPIGIIGVGRMGQAMAKHLLRHGYPVTVCDLLPENVSAAVALGAKAAETPEGLGQNCAFIIVAVGYDTDVMTALFGESGLFPSLAPGAIVAISSTVSVETVKTIAAKAAEKEASVLDAPLCRGPWFADAAQLLALMGGSEAVVARARPVFGCFCSDIAHVGDAGLGQLAKTINNLLLWANSIALIEAGRIAEWSGIDLPTLRDALMMSSGASQALKDWDQTAFRWALKDMQIVSQMTDAANLSLPLTGAVRELVKDAKRIKAESPPGWTRGT